ncbi:hypothetical protein EGR_05419 [Echinococcus granulosus]|uniref:Uncharacterized protein n=1 Tax=Echinococcus granulosus TaxID=6210 RepID=W6UN85_ECHGR|nr:hypothetical protein EGR_05419 [Echinococcus granulosus]EUB59657.1 hypothetical protein EGR_05419 [Echinococcus granulosus]
MVEHVSFRTEKYAATAKRSENAPTAFNHHDPDT